tara:strand:+ start:2833 stop:3768 length:936 start_codon:yes stop_codon:yes gene_type:complete
MKQEVYDRFKDYKKNHCWQYEIRQQNLIKDLQEAELTQKEYNNLRIEDFEFSYVDKTNKEQCDEIKQFIERHEWLGKLPIWLTHRFTARLKKNDALAGVIIMATPNSFSNILGEENKNKEKLISRGACISWAPKNLASWLITKSIKYMVKNTEFRAFSAYSDPEAKELGTIYQACNFIYLGQKFGAGSQYLDPDNPKRGWFGSSGFADRSQIVRYAKKLEIEWQPEWYKMVGTKKNYKKVNWKTIPEDIATRLKQERKAHQERCSKRKSPTKHKYIYILGRTKKETKKLKKLFDKHNPGVLELAYPRERGE